MYGLRGDIMNFLSFPLCLKISTDFRKIEFVNETVVLQQKSDKSQLYLVILNHSIA